MGGITFDGWSSGVAFILGDGIGKNAPIPSKQFNNNKTVIQNRLDDGEIIIHHRQHDDGISQRQEVFMVKYTWVDKMIKRRLVIV